MKLKVNDIVYLEHFDVKNFLSKSDNLPQSIRDELSEMDGIAPFGVYGQFAYAFKRPENVRWLMKQKYFLEYTKYMRYSTPKLKRMLKRSQKKYKAKLDKYNKQDQSHRAVLSQWVLPRLTRMHKFARGLEHLIYCRKNGILFRFAEEIHEAK